MIINNNISSLTATNAIQRNEMSLNKSIAKLSSGMRINKAADDAAGLAVSEKMRSQIRGLDVAKRNIQDGISLVQTAEGAMDEVHSMLQRMKELTVQGTNGIYTSTDTANLQAEFDQLKAQITEIADKTTFNGVNILNNTGSVNIQTGVNAGDKIAIKGVDVKSATLGIDALTVNAEASLAALDKAINTVSTGRANLGAVQNRLEHTLSNVMNTHENISAAESRIRDVDMAKEMSNFSAKNVLLSAGMSVAAQANQKTSLINKLL